MSHIQAEAVHLLDIPLAFVLDQTTGKTDVLLLCTGLNWPQNCSALYSVQ